VKKTRQIKNLEPRFDSIETEKALGVRSKVFRRWARREFRIGTTNSIQFEPLTFLKELA
jgi:hypothetical protein